MRILGKTAIAHFHETEDPLENVKDVFNTRAHTRFSTIRFPLPSGKVLGARAVQRFVKSIHSRCDISAQF
jgi:hypothetical protein